jgi:hypothetical protein
MSEQTQTDSETLQEIATYLAQLVEHTLHQCSICNPALVKTVDESEVSNNAIHE